MPSIFLEWLSLFLLDPLLVLNNKLPASKYPQAEAQWYIEYLSVWVRVCMCACECWGLVVGGGERTLQYQFKPISDIFHGLEVSVERGGSLWALFMDHGLFTMKPSSNPEEMWAKMFYLLSGLQLN